MTSVQQHPLTDVSSWRCSVFCTTFPNEMHTVTNTSAGSSSQTMNCLTLKMKALQSFETSGRFQKHVEEKYAVRSITNDWIDLYLKQGQGRSTEMTITITRAVFACYDSDCRQRVAACGADRGTQTQTIHISARIGYPPLPIMSVSHYSPQCSPHHTTQVPLLCSHSDIYIKQTC
jgi:hypothetical protein